MTKKVLWALSLIGSVCAASGLFAGEMENLAAGSEKSFSSPLPAKRLAFPAQDGRQATADEYQRLCAAFAEGAAPSKEELTGWHAGRIFNQRFPSEPGSLLLAGGEMPAAPEKGPLEGTVYKLVPLTTYVSPTFYETLDADITAGARFFIRETHREWTEPQFTATGVTFERVTLPYENGFSRYEARKTRDNLIVVKHSWRGEIGGNVSAGTAYAFFTKDVTPK